MGSVRVWVGAWVFMGLGRGCAWGYGIPNHDFDGDGREKWWEALAVSHRAHRLEVMYVSAFRIRCSAFLVANAFEIQVSWVAQVHCCLVVVRCFVLICVCSVRCVNPNRSD